MTHPKAISSVRTWDAKAFLTDVTNAGQKNPESLTPEKAALLEILEAGSPEVLAPTKKQLLTYFRKSSQCEVLKESFRETVDKLALARKNRPTPAEIERAKEAGIFSWSREEVAIAQNAIEQFRRVNTPGDHAESAGS